MRAVQGFDASWALTQPSAATFAAETPTDRRLIAVVSSYR